MRGLPWLRLVLDRRRLRGDGRARVAADAPGGGRGGDRPPPPKPRPREPSRWTLKSLSPDRRRPGFQIKQIDRVLLQGAGPELSFRGPWEARLPKEGVDLTFEAHWPPDAPQTAARLSVGFPDGQKIEKTFWARGSLLEVITIPATPGETPASP